MSRISALQTEEKSDSNSNPSTPKSGQLTPRASVTMISILDDIERDKFGSISKAPDQSLKEDEDGNISLILLTLIGKNNAAATGNFVRKINTKALDGGQNYGLFQAAVNSRQPGITHQLIVDLIGAGANPGGILLEEKGGTRRDVMTAMVGQQPASMDSTTFQNPTYLFDVESTRILLRSHRIRGYENPQMVKSIIAGLTSNEFSIRDLDRDLTADGGVIYKNPKIAALAETCDHETIKIGFDSHDSEEGMVGTPAPSVTQQTAAPKGCTPCNIL